MSHWFVYFILMLDTIVGMFTIFGGMALIVTVFLFMCLSENDKNKENEYSREGREQIKEDEREEDGPSPITPFISLIISIMFFLAAAFTPDTKQAAIIYLVPKITNNEQVQDISGKSLDLLDESLESYLKQIKEK